MKRHRMAICAALPLVLLAGCFGDGGSSDREEIESVIERAFEAALNGDSETYCSLLTGRAFNTFDGRATKEDCVRRGHRDMVVTEEDRADVAGMRVTLKRIEGDDAKASVLWGGRDEEPFPLLLERVDGEWLISDFDPNRYGEKVRKRFEEVDRSLRTARDLDCSKFQFDARKWRRGRDDWDEEAPTSRQRLADAALKCHTFVGLKEREAIVLLGRPEDRYDKGLSWTTGPERGFISLDSEFLFLALDAEGRVRRAELSPG